MRSGVVLPGGTATEQLDQAILAEEKGWDGVFAWPRSAPACWQAHPDPDRSGSAPLGSAP